MTDQPTTNPGGRPAIGPAISVAYPEELLARIDKDANRQRTTRAHWLRSAAASALPYDQLTDGPTMHYALRELDDQLSSQRDAALDIEVPREERVFQAEAYATCVHEMRSALLKAVEALPVPEARDAYEQAEDAEPDMSAELARALGRSMAMNQVETLLNVLAGMLPIGAGNVLERAPLDDPNDFDAD